MLRRHPTTITLTSEDIAAYEDSRVARLARLQNNQTAENQNPTGAQSANNTTPGGKDPNDELKPLPGDRARAARGALGGGVWRGREERIMGR